MIVVDAIVVGFTDSPAGESYVDSINHQRAHFIARGSSSTTGGSCRTPARPFSVHTVYAGLDHGLFDVHTARLQTAVPPDGLYVIMVARTARARRVISQAAAIGAGLGMCQVIISASDEDPAPLPSGVLRSWEN